MATCERCGSRCTGRRCRMCEVAESNEKQYGVPDDHVDEDDGEGWEVKQRGLDGGRMTGQATISGGVARDRGDDRD